MRGAAVAAYVFVGHHAEKVDVKSVVARAFEHQELALLSGGLGCGFGLLFGGDGGCGLFIGLRVRFFVLAVDVALAVAAVVVVAVVFISLNFRGFVTCP